MQVLVCGRHVQFRCLGRCSVRVMYILGSSDVVQERPCQDSTQCSRSAQYVKVEGTELPCRLSSL